MEAYAHKQKILFFNNSKHKLVCEAIQQPLKLRINLLFFKCLHLLLSSNGEKRNFLFGSVFKLPFLFYAVTFMFCHLKTRYQIN